MLFYEQCRSLPLYVYGASIAILNMGERTSLYGFCSSKALVLTQRKLNNYARHWHMSKMVLYENVVGQQMNVRFTQTL